LQAIQRQPPSRLDKGMGLWGATSANMINMVGVGPFITIPLALAAMGGPQAMLGWIAGALIAICDGMVWAELGAAMPRSGGPYYYLLEAFGPRKLGRLVSFLFLWQAIAIGPISIASGAVGLADYAKYLFPSLLGWKAIAVAAGVCLLNTALLYRNIKSISVLSLTMWGVVMATTGWILFAGVTHFEANRAFDFPPHAFHLSRQFFYGLGGATLIALYDYGGYYNVCLFGEEVREPKRTIPRSILISIVVLGVIYLMMNISIIGVVPWQHAMGSKAVVAEFIEGLYGPLSGKIVASLILWAAFASVFAILLGYSRIPYAAAVDKRFFSIFAYVHPTKHFPAFSVVLMGVGSAVACLLSLTDLINYMMVFQIMLQFVAQCVAVILLRRTTKREDRPYNMPLYPLPAVLAIAGWMYILMASGWKYVGSGFLLTIAGSLAYLGWARHRSEWPFEKA
jgi:amino acid transporter